MEHGMTLAAELHRGDLLRIGVKLGGSTSCRFLVSSGSRVEATQKPIGVKLGP